MNKIFKVGLIGCGHISETYFRGHDYFNNFQIIKCADINIENAKKCAETYGIEACSVDELLNDSEVEIILNLTIPKAHYEVAKKSLEHGKHVYSEKPMAVNFVEGEELLNLANSKNLYIGNAPDTFLGGGIQKSIDLINQDKIGNVRLGSAIFAYPGVQSYHPNPEPWFANNEGGPVMDMGPYYLTALVNLLGPAKRVHGISTKVFEKRVIGIGPKKDQEFTVECPTSYLVNLEFHNQALIQITLSFDVVAHQRNHIELYGDKGSMIVPDPNMFGGSVMTCVDDSGLWEEHKTDELPLGKINITSHSGRANESPTNANYRGVGLAEMAYCIEHGLKHRCSGELSLHVLDIIKSTMIAADTQSPQDINTTCQKADFFTLEEIQKFLNSRISNSYEVSFLMKFDTSKKVLVIGRAGMDIYPEPPGTKISEVKNFSSHLGGSAANTCVALSLHGIESDLVTCVSNDAIGEFILNKLGHYNVGTKHCLKIDKSFQTQLAVVETILENNQSILYRNNACDLKLDNQMIDQINFQEYGAVFYSGTALSSEPSRSSVLLASEKAQKVQIPQIIDLDYRPYNWESDEMKSIVYQKIMNEVDIIIGNDLEFNIADNSENGFLLANDIIKSKPSIVIYKMGEKGSIVITSEESPQNYGIYPVQAIKPTGAGDAFNGGFLSSLIKGKTLDQSVKTGSASAAIVVTRVGCSSAMPTSSDVEEFLKKHEMGSIT